MSCVWWRWSSQSTMHALIGLLEPVVDPGAEIRRATWSAWSTSSITRAGAPAFRYFRRDGMVFAMLWLRGSAATAYLPGHRRGLRPGARGEPALRHPWPPPRWGLVARSERAAPPCGAAHDRAGCCRRMPWARAEGGTEAARPPLPALVHRTRTRSTPGSRPRCPAPTRCRCSTRRAGWAGFTPGYCELDWSGGRKRRVSTRPSWSTRWAASSAVPQDPPAGPLPDHRPQTPFQNLESALRSATRFGAWRATGRAGMMMQRPALARVLPGVLGLQAVDMGSGWQHALTVHLAAPDHDRLNQFHNEFRWAGAQPRTAAEGHASAGVEEGVDDRG